jgi:hypothetical protein
MELHVPLVLSSFILSVDEGLTPLFPEFAPALVFLVLGPFASLFGAVVVGMEGLVWGRISIGRSFLNFIL